MEMTAWATGQTQIHIGFPSRKQTATANPTAGTLPTETGLWSVDSHNKNIHSRS